MLLNDVLEHFKNTDTFAFFMRCVLRDLSLSKCRFDLYVTQEKQSRKSVWAYCPFLCQYKSYKIGHIDMHKMRSF